MHTFVYHLFWRGALTLFLVSTTIRYLQGPSIAGEYWIGGYLLALGSAAPAHSVQRREDGLDMMVRYAKECRKVPSMNLGWLMSGSWLLDWNRAKATALPEGIISLGRPPAFPEVTEPGCFGILYCIESIKYA